jgi:hypothetical protein
MPLGVIRHDLVVWVALAFAVWVALVRVLPRWHMKGAGVVAALLSWLLARAVVSWLPMLRGVVTTHLMRHVGGRLWP